MNRQRTGRILMVLGVVFILAAVSLLMYNNYENKMAEKRSGEVMEALSSAVEENKIEGTEDVFDTEMTEVKINGYNYVGYVTIPALKLDLPVMSECDYRRLKIAPCRYYGSVKTDNLVICAHNYRFHFGFLGHLEKGDYITFTDMDGKEHIYEVKKVDQVLPTDVDKVKDTGYELTLYTCTYGGARRIVVRGEKVGEKQPEKVKDKKTEKKEDSKK